MDDRELELLLKDVESDRAERKASMADRDRIRQAICAFANDLPNHRQPGVIFIGANDDGSPSQAPITDEVLLNLAHMRSDGNIMPFPSMSVQKKRLFGCDMAVVIVQPADAPPVRCRGRVWIRVGPRRATASAEEERRLTEKRRSKDIPFDIQPVTPASVDDLDLVLFQRVYLPAALPKEILDENQRTCEMQLSSLRFATADTPACPTIAGILVIGKDPPWFLPGAYIQFLRIEGTQWTDPIHNRKEIKGPLPDLMRWLDEVLDANISVATDFTSGPVEIRRPDYPIVALQQITRNAVLHRTYEGTNAPVRITWFSDRVEILSPGGPYGQVTRENLGQPGIADYRNPHLAEAMKNLAFIQRFGMGIYLARQEMEKNNNPPPEFETDGSFVRVTLRKRR